MGVLGFQASSSKQQASIRHQASGIKHQAASINNLGSGIARNREHLLRLPISHQRIFPRQSGVYFFSDLAAERGMQRLVIVMAVIFCIARGLCEGDGWNFGIFYWDQFADEDCYYHAELKVWGYDYGTGKGDNLLIS